MAVSRDAQWGAETVMVDERRLRKYAELAIRIGVNLQPGQPLVVGYWRDPVLPAHVDFARMLCATAYDVGASFVQVEWGDEWWLRETAGRGALDLYAARCKAQAEWVARLADAGAAFLRIPAADPGLFAGVDGVRVAQAERVMNEAFNAFNFRRTNDMYRWSLVAAPTQPWADQVHPELSRDRRVPALWEDILTCARADGDDPVSDWKVHLAALRRRRDWLNALGVREMHYVGPGTDLCISLPAHHRWAAAGHETDAGVPFVANIPTEEVYTVPLKTGVQGVVASTLPLNHGGALITGIRLRFERGRIVEYSAGQGQEALRHIIETDEGSHYLGEVALVPVDSPIARRGTLFFNTLFDENASCHVAIGKAYPLIAGGHTLAREAWAEHGLNDSLVHVDFMIGSPTLRVTARTAAGSEVPVLENGRWVEEV